MFCCPFPASSLSNRNSYNYQECCYTAENSHERALCIHQYLQKKREKNPCKIRTSLNEPIVSPPQKKKITQLREVKIAMETKLS